MKMNEKKKMRISQDGVPRSKNTLRGGNTRTPRVDARPIDK